MEDTPQPIIIKRIVKGGGAHGGGWKVAFADFATAMMAFFLVMWLMGGTSAEEKGGISQYFKNPSAVQGASPTPSPTAVQGQGGPSSGLIKLGGSTELYKNRAPANAKEDEDPTKQGGHENDGANGTQPNQEQLAKQALVAAEKAEAQSLENLEADIKKQIAEDPALQAFKDQILMDQTAEGLRIQIIDQENRSMFDIGSATLKDYSMAVMLQLSKAIQKVSNHISVSGHTDNKKYFRQNYGNWELSTDRANAARRALIAGGMPDEKIGRVVGLADTVLLDTNNRDNPMNRRISIIVMNSRTEAAIKQESSSLFSVQRESSSTPAAAAAVAPNASP